MSMDCRTAKGLNMIDTVCELNVMFSKKSTRYNGNTSINIR